MASAVAESGAIPARVLAALVKATIILPRYSDAKNPRASSRELRQAIAIAYETLRIFSASRLPE
jgi:hypothetical protein